MSEVLHWQSMITSPVVGLSVDVGWLLVLIAAAAASRADRFLEFFPAPRSELLRLDATRNGLKACHGVIFKLCLMDT